MLKLTKNGSVSKENIKIASRLPSSNVESLLRKLQNEGMINQQNDQVEVFDECRLKIAIKAIELGGDIERISDALDWKEFEEMAAVALEANGYTVQKNLRFKAGSKRWEIDVVGCRKPLVLCIDCKHWHQGMHPATLSRVVSLQSKRTEALAETLPATDSGLEFTRWNYASFVPLILSLVPFSPKFISGVPIVPALSLRDFVNQLPLNLDCVRQLNCKISHL